MKRFVALPILFAMLLTGCTVTNIDINQDQAVSMRWLDQFDAWKIAADYYRFKTKTQSQITLYTLNGGPRSVFIGTVTPRTLEYYEKALVNKGLSPEHLALIRNREICVGMNEVGMYAAWGLPNDINTDQNYSGTHRQYVYGVLGGTGAFSRKYVYTQNGIITSYSLR